LKRRKFLQAIGIAALVGIVGRVEAGEAGGTGPNATPSEAEICKSISDKLHAETLENPFFEQQGIVAHMGDPRKLGTSPKGLPILIKG